MHACLVLEKDGDSLVIDPGAWSTDLVVPTNVVGVVVTHEHADHCDMKQLANIVSVNPNATIYAHADIASKLGGMPTQAVAMGENVQVGDFALSFVGGTHATIHSSLPPIANLGVVVDETLYYPGDSFTLPDRQIQILALPENAPWAAARESMDFLTQVNPARAFPTHDGLLSEQGKKTYDGLLDLAANNAGIKYERLALGSTIDI